jgi:hypothetical protein
MKKTALFLFMLFAFVMKAQETQETFYIGERSSDKTKVYIYPKTVIESERPGYITAWFLSEYSVPQKLPNNKYYTKTKNQFLINCKYKKIGLITSISYSKNDDVIYNTESVNEYLVEEKSPSLGSLGESMTKAACYVYDLIKSNKNQE